MCSYLQHVSRTPGYNTVSGISSVVHSAHNSHNLASQAAQIAANKKTFDPASGISNYNKINYYYLELYDLTLRILCL